MSARDDILAAVRQGLGAERVDEAAMRAQAAALLADPDEIRPALAGADPVSAFVAKCALPALGMTLARVAGWDGLPAALRDYLDSHDLPHEVAVTPDARLAALAGAGIATRSDCAADQAVAVSVADWGIGETGSVAIHSAPDQPILHAFLPRHWVVVVEESKILPYLDDYAPKTSPAPRNAVMITGSSGTTDIEGVFVRGAHGPGFVHVLLIGG
ncbi:MAG: LUD domain-containing protein [Paracoccus sp. (in: a-proteobacteria)]|nr:LUD domain-containing protein [Paracoccus sp. (in: a-proteobacteria)]